MTDRFPRLIVFDLDYTLWDLWIDTFITGPLKRIGNTINEIVDKHDVPISFYPDVPSILHRLKAANVKIAACSRTHAPKLAHKALSLLLMPATDIEGNPAPAIEFFDELEIYPGSKLVHFKSLHLRTGIAYSDMLFFDDELRNKEVEILGVTFVHVRDGITESVFEAGLNEWKRRDPSNPPEDQQLIEA